MRKKTRKMEVIVHSIPPRAIEFVDLPDTKDQYLRNAFRHEIDIPDSIFPKQWMDLPEGIEKYDNKMPERVSDEL